MNVTQEDVLRAVRRLTAAERLAQRAIAWLGSLRHRLRPSCRPRRRQARMGRPGRSNCAASSMRPWLGETRSRTNATSWTVAFQTPRGCCRSRSPTSHTVPVACKSQCLRGPTPARYWSGCSSPPPGLRLAWKASAIPRGPRKRNCARAPEHLHRSHGGDVFASSAPLLPARGARTPRRMGSLCTGDGRMRGHRSCCQEFQADSTKVQGPHRRALQS